MKPLSIIIITYNRPQDTLLLLQNIANQQDAAALLERVVIVNNASTEDYSALSSYIDSRSDIPFHYVFSKENLGVARGRNKALEYTSAPIVITIDDDAYFKDEDALVKIVALFSSSFASQNNVGIYCFKVFYGSTGALQQTAFPHKKFDKYKSKDRFLTSYFIGCGHAIKRDVYQQTGPYPTDFFYGMEEYDLGYRAMNAGFSIAFDDSVTIIHNESPLGRTPHAEKMRMLWVNKSKVAYRYLPFIYFITTALMWSFEFLKKTSWNWGMWIKGWAAVVRIPLSEKRKRISSNTLRYLKKVEARLWY